MGEQEKNIQRKFIIGSEWLSYKLYMGTQTTDTFIRTQLLSIVRMLQQKEIIDSWFFIRYADPDFHLRLRFRLKDSCKIAEVTSLVYDTIQPLVEERLMHKVQIDTYSRELERYGYYTIQESENMFRINSEKIITLLHTINDDEHKRWLWGMKAIDTLLNSFGYTLVEKRDLLSELKTSFGKEFGINKKVRKQLSMKFRIYRKNIEELLDTSNPNEVDMLLKGYKQAYKTVWDSITKKVASTELKKYRNYLMDSYIHMHCNRLFPSKQRMNEWVLYDLLYQHYYSQYARKQKQTKALALAG